MGEYTKEDFIRFWGDGYIEKFNSYKNQFNIDQEIIYNKIIKSYENKEHISLEIGCGGGIWANKFVNKFAQVIAIDVIPKSKLINKKIKYYELSNCDYSCSPIEDNSIDFVWSFGVFCHLPNNAIIKYIKNIHRILKIGGNAVIMFADWQTHPGLNHLTNGYNYRETPYLTWFYMDKETINKILLENNIIEYDDLMPDFRDRLIHFKKS